MSDSSLVEVYRAKDTFQAQLCVNTLEEAGIKAEIEADKSTIGQATTATLLGGSPTWWASPRILVMATDAEKARALLLDLEARERDRQAATEGGPEIEVVCEECGEKARFPSKLNGTVQECPNCGEYVDVGQDEKTAGWGAEDAGEKEE